MENKGKTIGQHLDIMREALVGKTADTSYDIHKALAETLPDMSDSDHIGACWAADYTEKPAGGRIWLALRVFLQETHPLYNGLFCERAISATGSPLFLLSVSRMRDRTLLVEKLDYLSRAGREHYADIPMEAYIRDICEAKIIQPIKNSIAAAQRLNTHLAQLGEDTVQQMSKDYECLLGFIIGNEADGILRSRWRLPELFAALPQET